MATVARASFIVVHPFCPYRGKKNVYAASWS